MQEALAKGKAHGLDKHTAAREAGYLKGSHGFIEQMWERKDMLARVKAIKATTAAAEATSIEAMIRTLMNYADTASKAGSGAGMAAARGLIAEAAKLRMATTKTAPVPALRAPAPDDWAPRPYTEADWDRICQPD